MGKLFYFWQTVSRMVKWQPWNYCTSHMTDMNTVKKYSQPFRFLKEYSLSLRSRAGVGNSFGFAGHIRDNLGFLRPVHLHVTWF